MESFFVTGIRQIEKQASERLVSSIWVHPTYHACVVRAGYCVVLGVHQSAEAGFEKGLTEAQTSSGEQIKCYEIPGKQLTSLSLLRLVDLALVLQTFTRGGPCGCVEGSE